MEQAKAASAWNSVEWLASRLIAAKAGQRSDYVARGEARAEMGRRNEARADLAESWRERDCPLAVGSLLALLHQEAGDGNAHRAVVTEILDRHGNTTDPLLANNVAWNCGRFPGAVDDWTQVKKLAALAAGPENRRSPNGLNTLGAVLYRAGDSKGAIAAIEEGVRLRGNKGVLEDWAFLAMAHHELGEEAGPWLTKAQTALDQRLGKGGKIVSVRDLEAMLLVREAAEALREWDVPITHGPQSRR
jgi:tetratricopeptide (TPR) repeat protein